MSKSVWLVGGRWYTTGMETDLQESEAHLLIFVSPFQRYGCAQPNFPGVYARTSSAMEWIQFVTCSCWGDSTSATFCPADVVARPGWEVSWIRACRSAQHVCLFGSVRHLLNNIGKCLLSYFNDSAPHLHQQDVSSLKDGRTLMGILGKVSVALSM